MNNYPMNVGRYQIKAELGRGSMSAVYCAYDPLFKRNVAIKFLLPNLQHAQRVRERFIQEARIVAALDHPVIVPVYDFAEYDELPYLVMRLMPNGSLAERLRTPGMSLLETVRIVQQLAPALDEAHQQGIVHRDLKPSNILFDQRDMPFLTDFGIAKLIREEKKLTNTGYLIGTPAYMSPEQIEGRNDLDGRSDIYSLGVLCYEMLTGQLPFETDAPFALAVKHIFDPVPDIAQQRPDLPPACQTIIDKAMAKNREQRYETAVSLAAAFQSLLNVVPDKIELPPKTVRTLLVQNSPHNPQEKLAVVILDSQEQPDLLAKVTVEAPILPVVARTDWPLLRSTPPPALPPRKRPAVRRKRVASLVATLIFFALFLLESGNVLSNEAVLAPNVGVEETAVLTTPMLATDLAQIDTYRQQIRPSLAFPHPIFEQGAEMCGGRCQPNEEPESRYRMVKLQIK